MTKIDPMTDEFKAKLSESLLFTVKCNKCEFETYLFDGFNTIKGIEKQVIEHYSNEHNLTLQVGRKRY